MTQWHSTVRLTLAACAVHLVVLGCATEPAAAPTVMPPSPVMIGTAGAAAAAPAAMGAMAAVPGKSMAAAALPAAASGPAAMAPMSAVPSLGSPAMPAAGAAAETPGAAPVCKFTRKNAKKLTMQEKQTWIAAVLKLKETPSPYSSTLNYYDQFVSWHTDLQVCDPNSKAPMMMGHGAPMFLPWHREHLLLFDQAIRAMMPESDLATPYWDWSDPDTSAIFNDDFMGGTGDSGQNNAVTTGPFRKDAFVVKVDPPGLMGGGSPFIQRILGSPQRLPTPDEVTAALQVPTYDTAPWDLSSDPMKSFRSRLEGNGGGFAIGGGGSGCPSNGVMPLPIGGMALHNAIHVWVNGTLLTAASPNDPVFWLHHGNVDRIYAKWQEMHGTDTYVPKNQEFPANNVDDPMMPFDRVGIMVTAADVADTMKIGVCYEE